MPRTFDPEDSNVMLIIGSGAGGGTLGNELAQKGIRTVILEAGPRIEREQHIDDERQSFAQLAWLDKRTTSGSWQIAKDSPNFPAWTCKVVGGTTVHWTACSLRAQDHEFHAKDVYRRSEPFELAANVGRASALLRHGGKQDGCNRHPGNSTA
jgi:choline dehydrogenase-like flavoprotein